MTQNIELKTSELDFSYSRSGGPGGQHVNKTSTKVTLKWNIRKSPSLSDWQRSRLLNRLETRLNSNGEIVLHSDRFRDRGRNIADCLQKLSDLVTASLRRPKKRVPTKPTRSSKEARLAGKKRRSDVKKSRQKVAH